MTDEAFIERMRKGWEGGLSAGTVCGKGSTLAYTTNVRQQLPELIKQFNIHTICDAGAGDQHWITEIDLPFHSGYWACDLIPRSEYVVQWDITALPVPPCDLILCRHVLNHLDIGDVKHAIDLFKQSARLLLATQHKGSMNRKGTDYSAWDLTATPFNLGEPITWIEENYPPGSCLALWKLKP